MPFRYLPDPPHTYAPPLLPGAEAVCAWVQRVAVLVALAIGVSNLCVWLLGPAAMPPVPGFMVMRFNSAAGITIAALSAALWALKPQGWMARLAQALGALAALIGGLTAAQDLLGVELGIDQFFVPGTFPGDLGNAFTVHTGRMSLNAALSMFFVGLALAAFETSVPLGSRRITLAPGLALVAALPAALALVGYLLGVGTFTGLLRSTNILLHTAAALFALSVAILALRPDRPPVRRIVSAGADGLLLRWMLPGTVALLLVLGGLVSRGRAAGLVTPGEGTALMLYGGLVLLSGLLIAASRAVARQEASARSASAALRVGQERSRAILDTALDAVLVMDQEGRIAAWNPAAERIFGWRSDEIIGEFLAERIIPERWRDAHRRGVARYVAGGAPAVLGKRLEMAALRRDGSEFPVELNINPLPGAGATFFVGFIRDITDRQAAETNLRAAKEAAESASRAKDNFLAALSHELRTPLAPVLMTAAALREDERLPEDVREQMAMVERNIGLEARLIDDLLDLTRIVRGKLKLQLERCDVHALLGHAIEIVREDAWRKGVALEVQLDARRSELTGDPARLQQVFWNLIKNAVKFTPGGGRIQVRTEDHASVEGTVVVVVSDSGIGFDPGAADQLFKPFEQAGREGDHRFGGLGLGLAIARSIVDLHRGSIHAASEGPERGATFTVELPGASLPAPRSRPGEADANAPAPEPASLRLLVVEDHEASLHVLTQMLKRAGHRVVSARSVAGALAAAAANPIDAVVSDLGLPDGTGVELLLALRMAAPRLPGVALSGYGMEDDLARSREAGFVAHLVKPVDFEQLRRVLREIEPAPANGASA